MASMRENYENSACRQCEYPAEAIKIGKKLKIVSILFLAVLGLSFLPVFASFSAQLFAYLKLIWWAILLGFFLGGLIDYFVPEEFIFSYLGRKKKSSIFFAVIAGFLFSSCSHGILAISMQLHKKGASIPAVMAFLLATPWANFSTTILLFGFFGWKALFFVLAAMLIAVIAGFAFVFLEKFGLIEKSMIAEAAQNYEWENVKNFNFKKASFGVAKGAVDLANMVLWWILLGVLIAAAIGAFVPEHLFAQYLRPSFSGLILTLAFAAVIEICSEGSAPIAFEIFKKTGALGNPFVFLMAGVVTDYTEIGLIWTNIGKRAAIWLPIVTVPLVLFFGMLFNSFL